MKKLWSIGLFLLLFLVGMTPWFPAHAESGPGNGTEKVKALFADAQADIFREISRLEERDIQNLPIGEEYKLWLSGKANDGSNRLVSLKSYLGRIALQFQDPPCEDGQGGKSSICFFYDGNQPSVLISVERNLDTTRDLAMEMLIHEAGHFTGEMGHLFLDRLGVELVHALMHPQSVIATFTSDEIAPLPFVAKEGCDKGTSDQAKNLLAKATQKIDYECTQRRLDCDLSKIVATYEGVVESNPWVTMHVFCTIKAVLNLPPPRPASRYR